MTYLSALVLSLILINGRPNTRQIILSTFVAVWSIRLGWFLFARIHNNNGVDSRFTAMKTSRPRFLMAWTLQGVWVFFTMIPVLLLNQSIDSVAFGAFDYIGIPLWAIGFLVEIISDFQKSAFRKLAENKEKWIQSGLWSTSRHPNYFGEIILWIGVALCSFGGLGATPRAAFAFISPCFVALLLVGSINLKRFNSYQSLRRFSCLEFPYLKRKLIANLATTAITDDTKKKLQR